MWQDLVVCGISDTTDKNYDAYKHMCGFGDLIKLVQHVITDLIILSTVVVIGVFIYHGLMLITSFGNTSRLANAKKGLLNVLKGYVVIIAAWLIVYTIVNALVGPAYSLLSKP